MISGYNTAGGDIIRNLSRVVWREIKLYGFIIYSTFPKYEKEFYDEVPKLVKNGTIKFTEDRFIGLEQAGHAMEAVQRGTNKAKAVIIVAED